MDEKAAGLVWSLWAVSVMLIKKKYSEGEIFMPPYLEYSLQFLSAILKD